MTEALKPGMSRRALLGYLGGALAGGALASAGLAGASTDTGTATATATATATETVARDKLGIQLWTCLAEYEADMQETLSVLASIGYSYVEYALGFGSVTGTGGAKAFRKALDDNGLWCNGGHGTSAYPYNDTAWKQYVEDNLVVGARYLGANTGFPSTRAGCQKYVDDVHKAHEVARRMGFTGFQFNHLESAAWNRLTDAPGLYAWEYIAQRLPHDVWNPELDVDHAYQPLGSIGGVIRYIRKYPGRWSLFHMKDGGPNVFLPDGTWEQGSAAEFGTGVFGLPDPSDPVNRPHAGFQDVLTAVRESQRWGDVLLIAESDQSMATCVDYAELAYKGLNGLRFPYRRR